LAQRILGFAQVQTSMLQHHLTLSAALVRLAKHNVGNVQAFAKELGREHTSTCSRVSQWNSGTWVRNASAMTVDVWRSLWFAKFHLP
jgi:hypothetical protein